MNFEQFAKYVEENIKDYLPSKYADASIHIVNCRKTIKSESYTGIHVARSDSRLNEATPVISLEGIYKKMQEKNIPIEEIMKDIAGVVKEAVEKELKVDISKENILGNLFTAAVNFEKANLDDKPYIQINDIAIVAKAEVGHDKDEMSMLTINNDLAEMLGMSPDEIMTMAMENNPKFSEPVCRDMLTLMSDLMDADLPKPKDDEPKMYVLTNSRGMYGASFVADKQVLGTIADRLGGDFAILPSSVHELIIIPEIKEHMLPELKAMVEEVNRTLVDEQGLFLSDNVYVYNAKKGMVAVYDGELKPEKIKETLDKNPSRLVR
ncbi:DUF5688 family protein [Blautia wexlerae]|uniref:DUF5688 family protein n=1 Tax=Blautia wexlerae TaxID=418240 RepID=UPI0035BEA70A